MRRVLYGAEDLGGPRRQRERGGGEDRITRLRRLICGVGERSCHLRRQLEPMARHDGASIGERSAIGHRRARADHRRIIPRHVGNADRDDARGMRMLRKPPAFDAGEMLAHRVDFDDRGAAGEQRPRHCLLVRKREPGGGRDPVCRGAAGNQHQHQILGAGGIGEVERFAGRGETGCVGQRVARLDDAHAARRTAIAATGHGDTADAAFRHATFVEIVAFGDLGHGAGSLAGRQNEQASGGGRRQMRRQAALRVRGRHRRAEKPLEKGARRCAQGSSSGVAERPRCTQLSPGPLRMGSAFIAREIAERAAACWIILRAIGGRKARR